MFFVFLFIYLFIIYLFIYLLVIYIYSFTYFGFCEKKSTQVSRILDDQRCALTESI